MIVAGLVLFGGSTPHSAVWSAAPQPAGAARPGEGGSSPPVSTPVSPPPVSPPPVSPPPVSPASTPPRPVKARPGPPAAQSTGTRPAPFVQSFARRAGARPQAPLPSPTALHPVAPNADGCDHNYGSRNQCVPWTFPPGTTDRCRWLAAHGFKPLPVVGTDRLGLDTNRDGVACGPGDR